jgi:hypothetical protein
MTSYITPLCQYPVVEEKRKGGKNNSHSYGLADNHLYHIDSEQRIVVWFSVKETAMSRIGSENEIGDSVQDDVNPE